MFHIISDGGCDFTTAQSAASNVTVVPFYVNFDGEFLKVGEDISTEEFFTRLSTEKGIFPKTSQPNPQDYIDAYTPHLSAGKDLLVLTISSKLSGSYNSASIAADILQEDFPNRKIILVDTLSGSIAQGLILREIVKMRDAGYSVERAAALAEKVKDSTKVYITLDTLEYLKRGGRIGPTTALVGNILGLRPILHVVDGEIHQLDNVRGKKNVFKLIEEALVHALEDEKEHINLGIGHIFYQKDAEKFKKKIELSLGRQYDVPVTEVGATIGAHAGPGALIFSYCKKFEAVEGA